MTRLAAVFVLTAGFAVGGVMHLSAHAGTLYQWVGKDGTPTYSPDPPPDGVKYELVGADLKPLPKNVDLSRPAAAPAAKTQVKKTTVTQAPTGVEIPVTGLPTAGLPATAVPLHKKPKKAVPKWKPVRYADDPNPPIKQTRKQAAKATSNPVSAAELARNQPGCVKAKQRMVLLESQFAEAANDKEMDQAILQLREQKPVYLTECAIPVK